MTKSKHRELFCLAIFYHLLQVRCSGLLPYSYDLKVFDANAVLLVAKLNSHFEPDQPIKLTQGLFCLCEAGMG